MTTQSEIIDDPNYIAVLDHGFVGLVDHMGDDTSIVQAARVSYGAGTKSVREDRGLIRYLFRHRHTSPVEMCEIKYHVRLPIFVMRQLVRHRTASLNEYSGRYSIMTDDFYVPADSVIQPQSSDNKQGRSGTVSDTSKGGVKWLMKAVYDTAYDVYQTLLGEKDEAKFIGQEMPFDPYSTTLNDPLLDENFNGVARELARAVLPVGNYTELYWKQNLHNLFHLLKLRLDPHAQYEIRVFAEAMYQLVQPIFPLACEAFEDYNREAVLLSRMEIDLMKAVLTPEVWVVFMDHHQNDPKMVAEKFGMSKRELEEFTGRFGL